MLTGYCPKPEPTPPPDIFFADNLGPIFIRMQSNPVRLSCETALKNFRPEPRLQDLLRRMDFPAFELNKAIGDPYW